MCSMLLTVCMSSGLNRPAGIAPTYIQESSGFDVRDWLQKKNVILHKNIITVEKQNVQPRPKNLNLIHVEQKPNSLLT